MYVAVGGTVYGLKFDMDDVAFSEAGNKFYSTVVPYFTAAAFPVETAALTSIQLASRDGRRAYVSHSGGGTVTLDALGTANHVVRITDTTATIVDMSPLPPQGCRIRLSIYATANTGNLTIYGNGAAAVGYSVTTLTNGQVYVMEFEVEDLTGTLKAYQHVANKQTA